MKKSNILHFDDPTNGEYLIEDDGSNHRYFTTIPNILLKLGLSTAELALYTYLKQTAGQSGECWKSSATISAELKMGETTLAYAKRSLQQKYDKLGGKPLITIYGVPRSKGGGRASHHIRIVDIWQENVAYFHGMAQARKRKDASQDASANSRDGSRKIHHTPR